MQPLTMIFGAGAIAGITAGWQHIKTLFARIRSTAIVNVTIVESLEDAFLAWCWANCRHGQWGDKAYTACWLYHRNARERRYLPFEKTGPAKHVFWLGHRPIWVGQGTPRTSDAPNSSGHEGTSVSFVRGTINIERVLHEACTLYEQHEHSALTRKRFSIRTIFGLGPPEARNQTTEGPTAQGPPSTNTGPFGDLRPLSGTLEDMLWDYPGSSENEDPMDALAYPQNVHILINEAKRWLNSRNWFQNKGIPWRRGWQLHGPPGSGKTSLVRALAWKLDLPIVAFDLASMSNKEFTNAWKSLENSTPCIALLEDIDAIFNGRKNIVGRASGGLTFDCLLNAISGVRTTNGVFLIVTTNNGHQLDPALTRPGRLDKSLELSEMDEPCRNLLANRIIADCDQNTRSKAIADTADKTPATVAEHMASIALKHFWNTKEPAQNSTTDTKPAP